ncbi:anaerobic ribonucleoside-triphosphate reductase activating protein [Spirochaetota bacterium]
MHIYGIQKHSFVDFPGKISFVIFTQGCNLDCFYCHNAELIKKKKHIIQNIAACDVIEHIDKRKKLIDGVVVTGGEPTIQSGLQRLLRSIKKMQLSCKLDTNGTRPELIKKIIEKKLVDFISMDIKAPFEKYDYICGKGIQKSLLKESIGLIIRSAPDYEFRSTVAPQIDESDIIAIARMLKGAKRYILQQYVNPFYNKKKDLPKNSIFNTKAYSKEYIMQCVKKVRDLGFIGECFFRGAS